jgi:hypothetical protein
MTYREGSRAACLDLAFAKRRRTGNYLGRILRSCLLGKRSRRRKAKCKRRTASGSLHAEGA